MSRLPKEYVHKEAGAKAKFKMGPFGISIYDG